jgi:hypothetical protein
VKRDLELIRLVLLDIEANNDPTRTIAISMDGYTHEEVQYHIKLLKEAGYIVAQDRSTFTQMDYRPKSLTWAGHEFLDAARNDTVWRQVKVKLKEMGVDAPLSVVQQLAIKYVSQHLGLGSGE